MATNTAGTNAHELSFAAIHYIRYNLVETSPASFVVGTLPAGAVLIPALSGVFVNVLFSGTDPAVDLGVTGSLTLFASALDLDAALGYVTVDEMSGDTCKVLVDTPVVATYVASTPTTGVGDATIILAYYANV